MKKLMTLVVAVAVALAFSMMAQAEETKVKVEEKGGTTTVKATEKSPGTKETLKATEQGTTVTGKDVVKSKTGPVAKETVAFEKYEAQGDYIYVVKDTKVIRLKHTLNDSMKKDMMGLKKGDTVTITSTHPLTAGEVAIITALERIQKAAAPAPTAAPATTAPKTK